MIPAEAVEAAAKALWELDLEPGQKQYEDCREGAKRNLRREATAMLEAAAPYMLATVYEEGWLSARDFYLHSYGPAGGLDENPYRRSE